MGTTVPGAAVTTPTQATSRAWAMRALATLGFGARGGLHPRHPGPPPGRRLTRRVDFEQDHGGGGR